MIYGVAVHIMELVLIILPYPYPIFHAAGRAVARLMVSASLALARWILA